VPIVGCELRQGYIGDPLTLGPANVLIMANFALGTEDEVRMLKEKKDQENLEKSRRHYKKDSRYLDDLYTLTYAEDISVDSNVDMLPSPSTTTGLNSLQVQEPALYSLCTSYAGPKSLGAAMSQGQCFTSSTLDTNLHKILARKIADSQEISFSKAKLLTKAYYKLLRDVAEDIAVPSLRMVQQQNEPRLSWQTLLQTDTQQLQKIVSGYSALIKSLNDELVSELILKDSLTATQDEMLETISELTDNLV